MVPEQTLIFGSQDVSVIFKSMSNLFIVDVSVICKVQAVDISILKVIKLIIQI